MQSSVATKKQFKRPGARVRASFTLENVFLIPLFTMIIVFLMGAGLYLHDNIIIKNALIQGTVILEKNIIFFFKYRKYTANEYKISAEKKEIAEDNVMPSEGIIDK